MSMQHDPELDDVLQDVELIRLAGLLKSTRRAEPPLDEAFRFLEEHDAERVPVVERGRLVGVLSRSVLQRRLAEDEEPEAPSDE